MEGPVFFARNLEPSKKLRTYPWEVFAIKNGLVYENLVCDTDMHYCAIDLDRNRVYYVSEMGGFCDDAYPPMGR